ncbi:hypothetical protein DAEQUDRAFT_766081 [Daedalea quercina L-15889]|uniref:F-box domain-containing protein n=1 Tax=Daedalea quercina L-15889 TaxID=1314783 RepID=A0A165PVH7_9APHY|nr:hypothetical protein DAEQUDRAFT_766081 [Daedalea quercina L-15889]
MARQNRYAVTNPATHPPILSFSHIEFARRLMPSKSLQVKQSKWSARLPSELRHTIADHLSNDNDTRTLSSLGLTSRSWVTPAQAALFRFVRLLGSYRYRQLENLIDEAPEIAAYIRALAIICDGTFTWMDQDAPRILIRLRHVEELSIRNWCATLMTDETRHSLRMCFPKVRVVHMQDVAFAGNDFAVMLCAIPRLARLHLHDVHWSFRQRPMVPAAPLGDNHIDTLYFHGTSPLVLSWLAKDGPIAFRLRALDVAWEHPSVSADVGRALERSGAELEHATLVCNIRTMKGCVALSDWLAPPVEDTRPPQRDFTLVHNTRLRTLHLKIESPDGRSVLVGWIPALLDSVRSTCLQQVLLELRSADLWYMPWAETDELLAKLLAAHAAMDVIIHISRVEDICVGAAQVCEHVVNDLPRVAATQRLEVECKGDSNADWVPPLPPCDIPGFAAAGSGICGASNNA